MPNDPSRAQIEIECHRCNSVADAVDGVLKPYFANPTRPHDSRLVTDFLMALIAIGRIVRPVVWEVAKAPTKPCELCGKRVHVGNCGRCLVRWCAECAKSHTCESGA